MIEVRTAPTAALDDATLARARALLDEVFAGELTEHDWRHALGGVHALVWEDGELVGHASVVERRLLHGGRTLRTGYVEGVGVRAGRRRQGIGAALMEPLERLIRERYELGALGSTDEAIPFYTARGWLCWRGPTSVLTPASVRRTPEGDGGIFVLPVAAEIDLDAELTCDWRDGDVW